MSQLTDSTVLDSNDIHHQKAHSHTHGVIIFLLFLILILLAAGGFLLFRMWQQNIDELQAAIRSIPTPAAAAMTAPSPSPSVDVQELAKNVRKPDTTDFTKGASNALITVIEYGDLECPFCSKAHATVEQVLQTYPSQVNLAYRNFPISVHIGAHKKAEVAKCVAKSSGSEAYYKFIDGIYKRFEKDNGPYSVPLDQVVSIAAELTDVPGEEIQACLNKGDVAKQIDQEAREGALAGVIGTPTFFVVHNKTGDIIAVPGAQSLETFQKVIDNLIAKK